MIHVLRPSSLLTVAIIFVGTAEAKELRGLSKTAPAVGQSVETEQGFMVAYEQQIPGTNVTFEMVPIPGGNFLMGSPTSEANRNEDEGPQVRIEVPAFWMGKCEITWAEYHAYMDMYSVFKSLNELRAGTKSLESLVATQKFLELESLEVDGVTSPTPLYDSEFTYYPGGEPDQPAVTMTQFAAKQYTKWLSGITGVQYRLPTEAEWEYAARAGSTTAYCFGDDAKQLNDYAWHVENADDETHVVGRKQANAWGLFDMHGNAAEWVLDGYQENYYANLGEKKIQAIDAVAWPEKLFPRVIRGGCWFDDPQQCRSAARHKSDDIEWSLSDPSLPRSPWWFTEDPSTGVGFRILRPFTPMDEELREKVWDADIKWIQEDVDDRLDEGRGTISGADKRLPEAAQELREADRIE